MSLDNNLVFSVTCLRSCNEQFFSHEHSCSFLRILIDSNVNDFSGNVVHLVVQRCLFKMLPFLIIVVLTICPSGIYREITMALKKEGGKSRESKSCISTNCFLSTIILNSKPDRV